MSVKDATVLLAERLINIFRRGNDGRIPAYGIDQKMQHDPHFDGLYLFYEYFHGDVGAGLGANHQTGWTGLVADLIEYVYKYRTENVVVGK
jgi:hypothetical protein